MSAVVFVSLGTTLKRKVLKLYRFEVQAVVFLTKVVSVVAQSPEKSHTQPAVVQLRHFGKNKLSSVE